VHEGIEEHEERKRFFFVSFNDFVIFVVRNW